VELSRWRECKVHDFVPIFVGRRVRAQLFEFVRGAESCADCPLELRPPNRSVVMAGPSGLRRLRASSALRWPWSR
jgi:hypothetical protein